MADPVTIAQTGVDPVTGSYLSSEKRKAIFRSTRVSGFTGGGGGGEIERGGAIIVRPQTSLIDRTQNLQIQTTQQSVGALQQSLDFIRINVQTLYDGINNLGKQLQLEGALEEKNLKDQQEAERKIAERRIRLGRENELERKIIASLSKPIAAIQQRLTGLFDRIMGSMTTLFFGWLTNQGIETLKALSSGNSKKLEEIKDHVIKNVLYSAGAFAAVNIGLGLLLRTVTGLTAKIIGLTARIALSPFRAAGSLIGKILGLGSAARLAPSASRAAGTRAAVTGSTNMMTKFFNSIRSFNPFARGAAGAAARTGGRFVPGLGTFVSGGLAAYDFSKGNVVGGLLNTAAMIPGFGIPFSLARIGYGAATGEFNGLQQSSQKPETKAKQPTPLPTPAPAPVPQQPVSNPQVNMMPQAAELTLTPPQLQPQPPVKSNNETSVPDLSNVSTDYSKVFQMPSVISSSQIQKPLSQPQIIEPLSAPKPNIIIAGGGRDRTQVATSSQQEPITDVPFIPSGNTDNFYILYSQLNYNVVM